MKRFLLFLSCVCAAVFLIYCSEKESARSKKPDSVVPENGRPAPIEPPANVRFTSLRGMIMAGYQGWFNTPTDGAGLRWKHYEQHGRFEPGTCSIDLWPDVSEYDKTYLTPFRTVDDSPATLFSSRDASTIDVHFRWMKEYGIDGVFMQRFGTSLKNQKLRNNYNVILDEAVRAAEKHDRAICLMYDLSGMDRNDIFLIKKDWEDLVANHYLTDRKNNHYVYYKGRPLVAIWGVGFSGDKRDYGLDGVQELIDFFRVQNCSILLGVPSQFHILSGDCLSDPQAEKIFQQADMIFPWFVGRYKSGNYERYRKEVIYRHTQWCKLNKIDYMVDVFPGFSWHNLTDGDSPFNSIPRLKGEFFWKQLCGAIKTNIETIYISMFDEIDEATAIFKCTNEPPVGEGGSQLFIDYEGLPSDYYLWLSGLGGKMLRGDMKPTMKIPERN